MGIHLGGCCENWTVTWRFVPGQRPMHVIENGFLHHATEAERDLLLAGGKIKEAVELPTPAGEGANFGQTEFSLSGAFTPKRSRNLAESRAYCSGTKKVRVRVTTSPLAVRPPRLQVFDPVEIGGPSRYEFVEAPPTWGPHLYLKVSELPLRGAERASIEARAWGLEEVPLTFDPGGSDDGFYVYTFSGDEILFTAAPNVRAVIGLVAGLANSTGVLSAEVVDGGEDYSTGDLLDVVGGTGSRAARIKVLTTDEDGAIETFSVVRTGWYSAAPANPVSVSGGTGSGATFNVTTGPVKDWSGAISQGELWKPRGSEDFAAAHWGGACVVGRMLNGVIVFKRKLTTEHPVLFRPFVRQPGDSSQQYFKSSFPNVNVTGAARNSRPGFSVFLGDRDIFMESSLRRSVFDLRLVNPPADGDTIVFNGTPRTWRETVVDPATEIECVAFDPEDAGDVAAALLAADERLTAHLTAYPPMLGVVVSLGGSPFALPESIARSVFNFFQVTTGRWAMIQTAQQFAGVDWVFAFSVTGDWATLQQKFLGRELDWRPSPNAMEITEWTTILGQISTTAPYGRNLNNGDTVDRRDYMGIPLWEDFDEEIELPQGDRPFVLQAFFHRYLEFDNPAPAETVVTLEVTPVDDED